MKKISIKIKVPKQRDFNHYSCQLKGIMRTKIIPNKKKKSCKFNLRKELSSYLNCFLQTA